MAEQGQTLSLDHVVARCAIHPRYLHPNNGQWDHAYLLDIKRVKGSFDYKASVCSREVLPTAEAVHEYGCGSAALSNENRRANGKDVTPLKTAAHYVGFYDVVVRDIVAQANDVYEALVEHWPEHGQIAHCHIVLREKNDLTEDLQKLKQLHRTNAITAIWRSMSGPVRHVCECDEEVRDRLSKLVLPPIGQD